MPAPVDPDLVAFVRAHLKQHGAEALRLSLLSEGLQEAEVDAALAEARKPPPKPAARFLPLLLGAGAAAAAAAFLALSGPSGKTGERDGSPGGRDPDPPALSDDRAYHGTYGFVIRVPDGYDVVSDFKDPAKTIEVVYLSPKGTDPTHFGYERLYKHLGILRLEVSPLRYSDVRIGLDAVRRGVTATLQARKADFETRELEAGQLKGFQVDIKEPFSLSQAFIVGNKVLYVLTGGMDDGKFKEVLEGLRESGSQRPEAAGSRLP